MRDEGLDLTISELAERTGTSVRSIRYYQTMRLIPPPRVEGRVGYYDARHIERLALIAELQEEGLNLRAIGLLLGGAEAVASDELRELKRAALDGWANEPPEEVTPTELLDRLNLDEVDERTIQRAVDLGMIAPGDEDGWSLLLPSVARAGAVLHELGVPPERTLDVLEVLREQTSVIAQTFTDVFDEAVLERFDARGRPVDEWPEVRGAVERLRPAAAEAVLAVFGEVMRDVVVSYLGELAAHDEEPT